MKRLIAMTLSLAMLILAIAPAGAFASGTLLKDYGNVSITIPYTASADLEAKFREYVFSVACGYNTYHTSSYSYHKYYYEASDIKHKFDSERHNKGLAFNTTENNKNTNSYEQETREIILYMLSQDIQNKKREMESLSPEQRAAFFPGVMYDPTVGEWRVNGQAKTAQTIYNAEVERTIQKEADKMGAQAINAFFDTAYGISTGGRSDGAYALNDIVTNMISSIWEDWCQMEYEEEQKYLKNSYRQAMINDVIAAQANVDDQMYSGLTIMKDELMAKGSSLSTDEQIMLEVLDELLDTVKKGHKTTDILNTSITISTGSMTVEQEIEKAAKELVDNMGMPEEIPLEWQEKVNKVLISVMQEVLRATCKALLEAMKPDGELDVMTELKLTGGEILSEATIDVLIEEIFTNIEGYDGEMDTNADGNVSCAEFTSWFISAMNKTKGIEKIIELVKKSKIKSELTNATSRKLTLDKISERYNELMPQTGFAYRQSYMAKEAAEKVKYWEQIKESSGFISALIGNAVAVGESTLKMASELASLKNVVENEVYYSYVSSAMYRAQQLAEKTRASVTSLSNHYSTWTNVENASLIDLKEYLDKVYVVFNTDLLGHSYYLSLAESYAYETDYIARLEEHTGEANQIMYDGTVGLWNKGGLKNRAAAIGFVVFSPIYGLVSYGSAIGMTNGVADYLKRVQKDSKIGSWLGENLCVSTYNHIADYVEESDMPSEYDSLFNQQ